MLEVCRLCHRRERWRWPPGTREISVRVLVIEDQVEMAEAVAVGLRHAQMAVDVALDGPSGLERALVNDYDVIVLDRDLPGLHGDRVCADSWPPDAEAVY